MDRKFTYIPTYFLLFLSCMFCANICFAQAFKDVSIEAGIDHAHISSNLFGGGIGILDYNNDGFEDIYLTGGTNDDKLYKNNGDGSFEDVSLMAGIVLAETIKTSGVVTGDLNNDGYDDVFVTTESSHRNLLFINNGKGGFTEQSEEAGIKSNVWSTGAAMADYNQDGLLDIYVINYIKENHLIRNETGQVIGFAHDCYDNHFYINQGDNTFVESAQALGIQNSGCGLAVTFTDYNEDHAIDLYIANDFGAWITPNTLYENELPNHTFMDKSVATGLNCGVYGMGIATGDMNNDGLFDYYITNIGQNVLFRNNGASLFEDIAEDAQVGNKFAGDYFATSWGANFFDYDLDGYEDLFVANGHMPSADFLKNSEEDPNKLYHNLGNTTFEDVSEKEGVDDLGISHGSTTVDYDNDGDLDLVVTSLSRSSNSTVNTLVYNNLQASQHHWVKFKLEGVTSNRSAIGSRVMVYQQGEVKVRELSGGSSHASMSTKYLHFGLGDNEHLDSIRVFWPGGESSLFENLGADESYYILEGSHDAQIMGCMTATDNHYNPKATYNTGCIQKPETVASLAHQNNFRQFKIFPNPATEKVMVAYPVNYDAGGISLLLTDTKGRVVFKQENVQPNSPLSLEKLARGCYWYKAFDNNGLISAGTLAIQ